MKHFSLPITESQLQKSCKYISKSDLIQLLYCTKVNSKISGYKIQETIERESKTLLFLMESYIFSEAVCNKLQIKTVLINILLNKKNTARTLSVIIYLFKFSSNCTEDHEDRILKGCNIFSLLDWKLYLHPELMLQFKQLTQSLLLQLY